MSAAIAYREGQRRTAIPTFGALPPRWRACSSRNDLCSLRPMTSARHSPSSSSGSAAQRRIRHELVRGVEIPGEEVAWMVRNSAEAYRVRRALHRYRFCIAIRSRIMVASIECDVFAKRDRRRQPPGRGARPRRTVQLAQQPHRRPSDERHPQCRLPGPHRRSRAWLHPDTALVLEAPIVATTAMQRSPIRWSPAAFDAASWPRGCAAIRGAVGMFENLLQAHYRREARSDFLNLPACSVPPARPEHRPVHAVRPVVPAPACRAGNCRCRRAPATTPRQADVRHLAGMPLSTPLLNGIPTRKAKSPEPSYGQQVSIIAFELAVPRGSSDTAPLAFDVSLIR